MKDPPPFLRRRNRQWHGLLSDLAHYRMQTLTRPGARPADGVIRRLTAVRHGRDEEAKTLIDAAVTEAKRYKAMRRGADSDDAWRRRVDAQWDAVVSAFDVYLEAEHQRWETEQGT